MDETLHRLQMRHLRQAVAALRVLDLDELTDSAARIGTPADVLLIDALKAALARLPDDGRH